MPFVQSVGDGLDVSAGVEGLAVVTGVESAELLVDSRVGVGAGVLLVADELSVVVGDGSGAGVVVLEELSELTLVLVSVVVSLLGLFD